MWTRIRLDEHIAHLILCQKELAAPSAIVIIVRPELRDVSRQSWQDDRWRIKDCVNYIFVNAFIWKEFDGFAFHFSMSTTFVMRVSHAKPVSRPR